jgi:hypothetical protein
MKPLWSVFWIGILIADVSVGIGEEQSPAGQASNVQVPPTAHPSERYAELWDSGWFEAPREDGSTVVEPAVEEEPFALRPVGLADLRGRQWVYLADERGRITELTFGRSAGGVMLIRIEEGDAVGEPSVVVLRQGSRLIRLELAPSSAFSTPRPGTDPVSGKQPPAWRQEVFSKKETRRSR